MACNDRQTVTNTHNNMLTGRQGCPHIIRKVNFPNEFKFTSEICFADGSCVPVREVKRGKQMNTIDCISFGVGLIIV